MIDLHCHMLPGLDDGAQTMEISIQMARMAVADGTTVVACTPHIYPGLYMNNSAGIHLERGRLERVLTMHDIDLQLVVGADAHLVPELLHGLRCGRVPTLHGSRYFLLEPPHHVKPPHFQDAVLDIMAAGYVPLITHPERLSWIERSYQVFLTLAHHGAWIQLTAGSITGRFGKDAQYWSQRLLNDGFVHVIASDAHNTEGRSTIISDALPAAEAALGSEEAQHLVLTRPQAVLDNLDPATVPPVPGLRASAVDRRHLKQRRGRRWYRRWL